MTKTWQFPQPSLPHAFLGEKNVLEHAFYVKYDQNYVLRHSSTTQYSSSIQVLFLKHPGIVTQQRSIIPLTAKHYSLHIPELFLKHPGSRVLLKHPGIILQASKQFLKFLRHGALSSNTWKHYFNNIQTLFLKHPSIISLTSRHYSLKKSPHCFLDICALFCQHPIISQIPIHTYFLKDPMQYSSTSSWKHPGRIPKTYRHNFSNIQGLFLNHSGMIS